MTAASRIIDWEQVHQQVAENAQALDQAFLSDDNRRRDTFRARAERLRQRRTGRHETDPKQRFLVFQLNEERYAVELSAVAQVFQLGKLTPVPDGPPELLGVASFDGSILSVIDPRVLLELPCDTAGEVEYALLVRCGSQEIALRTDQVEQVATFAHSEIQAADDELGASLLRFSNRIGPQRTVILDIPRLLAEPLVEDAV